MKKVGIFYGPASGSTEKMAMKIADLLGEANAVLHLVKNTKSVDFDMYENIILGCSTIGLETWDSGQKKSDWDLFKPEFEKLNTSGKVFALFGLGDHISYAHHFVDYMGSIGKQLIAKNATIVGRCDTKDYEFIESEAVVDGKFIGLPIDEDFEPELTDERIRKWVEALKKEFV